MVFSTLIYIEPVITLLIRYSNYFSNTELKDLIVSIMIYKKTIKDLAEDSNARRWLLNQPLNARSVKLVMRECM
jgi:hypothetical protein